MVQRLRPRHERTVTSGEQHPHGFTFSPCPRFDLVVSAQDLTSGSESHDRVSLRAIPARSPRLPFYFDDAFTRRFHAIVYFPMPTPAERAVIWQRTFPPQIVPDAAINWTQVASRYELTGANILNVAQWCAIEMLAEGTNVLSLQRLEAGILREVVKEGKIV